MEWILKDCHNAPKFEINKAYTIINLNKYNCVDNCVKKLIVLTIAFWQVNVQNLVNHMLFMLLQNVKIMTCL